MLAGPKMRVFFPEYAVKGAGQQRIGMPMARINVEQKALTDPRFSILGSHLSPLNRAPQDVVETAFGIFMMIRVWNYCLERGLLAVPARDLDALYPGLAEAMIDAELGEKVPRSRTHLVRIKGGEGRLDWLEEARRIGKEYGQLGAEHGVKGGRPRKEEKPPQGVSVNGGGGFQNNPLPAPAPAPAPSFSQAPESTEEADRFARFWKAYPRKAAKKDAAKAFASIDPSEVLLGTILEAIDRQRETDDWTKDKGRFIPYPASWLRAGQWEDQAPEVIHRNGKPQGPVFDPYQNAPERPR